MHRVFGSTRVPFAAAVADEAVSHPHLARPAPKGRGNSLFQRASALRRMVTVAFVATVVDASASAGGVQFLNALNDTPIEFSHRSDQVITPAVEQFLTTGENPYAEQSDVLKDGRKLYNRYCQACHRRDGKGQVGPDLTDEEWQYERTHTDVGRFEIIYDGGASSMQGFGARIDQDDILKLMAYIDTFRAGAPKPAAAAAAKPAPSAKTATASPPAASSASATAAPAGPKRSKPPVPFTEAFLTEATNIEVGGVIWADQCRHCHGAKAYPGKAPKLKPSKYKPDFVYRRITDGFRKMPAWEDSYSDEERMQITAYILSDSFSP